MDVGGVTDFIGRGDGGDGALAGRSIDVVKIRQIL